MMVGGVPNGACMLQSDWPVLWPMFRASIEKAFAVIEQRSTIPDFARQCLEAFRRRIGMSLDDDAGPISTAPAIGQVRFGDLLRLHPIGTRWGFDRGEPIDRAYIEAFLQRHSEDVKGRVLEAGDNAYTLRFGAERVSCSDVLHVDAGASNATIVADLARADHVGSDLFDCIILTQTLQYIFDVSAAVRTLGRILKPGGILLLSVPGIGQIDHDRWGEMRYWSMTAAGVKTLLTQQFERESVEVETRGNVLAAICFLHGLSQADIPSVAWQLDDPHFPVTILARAVKSGGVASKTSLGEASHLQSALSENFIRRLRHPDVATVMVVAAHPDDELIGAGGHLRFWPRVSIVHVTNGAPRDPRYAQRAGFPDPRTYAAVRRREAEDALSIVGIPAERVIALGFDDQDASFRLVELTHRLQRVFIAERPAVVVTHAYEGGHPDHDATCFAVHAACRLILRAGAPVPILVEMSSYFGRDGIRVTTSFVGPPPAATIDLDETSRELKRRMMLTHVSQKDVLKLFPVGSECFRQTPSYDFREPPHSGRLFYEFHDLGLEGDRWRELAAAALRDLGLEF